ncbi:adenylyl cyclase-associated protein 1 [Pteropus vampyrus]|uniref:Adenylyl cyclase-associated protein n=1 Tax=Pteropus vampyrus TaxID=132908 RepID=A0A6P6BRQ9_PTEVA|nr:adenylyl cyclase-associated protein 1 [Pteropus vampyrus]
MADMQNLVERLERVVGRLEAVSHASDMHCGYGDRDTKGTVPYVQAFDSLLAGSVAEYLKISKEIGGDVQKHAEMVYKGLKLEQALLVTASQCQQPAADKLSDLLAPISEQIQEVITLREKNRGSKLFNHLSAVSESIQALGWVAMAPKPGPYVKEMNDAATFYTNRVLKEYRDVFGSTGVLDFGTTRVQDGMLVFSVEEEKKREKRLCCLHLLFQGPVAKELSGLPSGPSAGSGPPPPPPGPPPPPVPTSSGSDDSASRSALFAQINQGESITHALKHVSDDMKTHKNPALKAQSGPVRSGPKPFSAPKPGVSPSPKPAMKKEPALLELEGKKWRVENQENVSNLVIDDTELKQVAYVYKCVNSTLQIKGKINSITIDNCKKLGLVFDDVVGIVEIINSRDVKVQVMGKVPTISINKTDGCHVYLSKNSLDCEIVSAKSSEMNVLIPTEGGDFNEFPVPEQFKTLWNGQKLVTTVTEIAG